MIETRAKEGKAKRVGDTIFRNWPVLTNYEYNHVGHIWVVWKNNARLAPFYKSSQVITCSAKLEAQEDEFFCSFIYASNCLEECKLLWRELMDHQNSPIIRTKPWLLIGDFNEILEMEEHSGFQNSPTVSPGIREFRATVNHCSLTDMACHSPLYTWCNKQEGGLISKKLDRVLVNDVWNHKYPQS